MDPVRKILGIRKDKRSNNYKPWSKEYNTNITSFVWFKDGIIVSESYTRKDYIKKFGYVEPLKPNDKFFVVYGNKNQIHTKGFISRLDANNFIRMFKTKR